MAIITLSVSTIDTATAEAIKVCKSNSGICGKRLRSAHKSLGEVLGTIIANDIKEIRSVSVIVMMRAGLSFALGIADGLEDAGKAVSIVFSTMEKPIPNGFNAAPYDLIILVDAVIRTGIGMINLAEKIGGNQMVFATNVLDETGIPNLKGRTVYAVRVSKNSFVGSVQTAISGGRGPDTGERLCNSCFIKGN